MKKKVLILTANPVNTVRVRLDQEVRDVEECLKLSRLRDQFEVISKWAVRTDDLQQALIDHEPQIVHFSGHGAGDKGLILENQSGQLKPVNTDALARLFRLFKEQVECVLLNACYSEVQAVAIHEHIDHVIGMSQAIGDLAAIEFAKGFYRGLGGNRNYAEAFEFGLSAIDLEGIPEIATPKLKQRDSSPSSVDLKPDENVLNPDLTADLENSGSRSRIFISYKRGISPDEDVALAVFKALNQHHDVFIDQTMAVGTPWAKKIEEELQRSGFLISFLSPNSVSSEMVRGEIETAHRLEKQQGKPRILPVRLKYREPFNYPLSAYLNSINWAFWDDSADTPRLIKELMRAIAGQALPIGSEASKRDLIIEQPPSDNRPLAKSKVCYCGGLSQPPL